MPGKRKAWPPIIERAAEIVDEYDTAVTLRQLFYRLVAEGLIDNKQSDYTLLSRLTATARRDGTFPSLVDRTRSIERAAHFTSPTDALEALAQQYRRDRLEGQDVLPIIVVEKATLVAQVYAWFGEPWGVPIAALRGYASESYQQAILALVDREVDTSTRDVELFYCGDFDPTGEDIPRAFEDNTGLTLQRVALDWEQVEKYDLPPAVGKSTDSRAAAFVARHGQLVQVELEALPPEALRELLQSELDALIDTSMIQKVREREDVERRTLYELAETWTE
jgi:hypothetical protein